MWVFPLYLWSCDDPHVWSSDGGVEVWWRLATGHCVVSTWHWKRCVGEGFPPRELLIRQVLVQVKYQRFLPGQLRDHNYRGYSLSMKTKKSHSQWLTDFQEYAFYLATYFQLAFSSTCPICMKQQPPPNSQPLAENNKLDEYLDHATRSVYLVLCGIFFLQGFRHFKVGTCFPRPECSNPKPISPQLSLQRYHRGCLDST